MRSKSLPECQNTYVIKCIESIAASCGNSPSKIGQFLWRYERNKEDIEDIVQDSLLAALECSGKFKNKSSVKTWLRGVMLNMARHHVANRVHESRIKSSLLMQNNMHEDIEDSQLMAIAPCPSNTAELNELCQKISTSLDCVSQDIRDTFELVCIHEKTYQEAAESMGIPIGTIRSRINRVRSILRDWHSPKPLDAFHSAV